MHPFGTIPLCVGLVFANAIARAMRERSDAAPRCQRPFLDRDAAGEERQIGGREDRRYRHCAEGERQDRDLGDDDQVIGMINKPIRSAPHQRFVGWHDQAGRPIPAEAGDDSQPAELQRGKHRQQRP